VSSFDGKNTIYVLLGESGTDEFYLKAGDESVYGYGTKKPGELYNYTAPSPDNCKTPSILFHELIHYFNHLGVGRMPMWLDESVARMGVDQLVKQICPPGITYKNVTKDGQAVDNFDFNADDQVKSMDSDFWQGSQGKLDYLMGINKQFQDDGLSYFHKLYYTMKNGSYVPKG
jgi:hypothetical protein